MCDQSMQSIAWSSQTRWPSHAWQWQACRGRRSATTYTPLAPGPPCSITRRTPCLPQMWADDRFWYPLFIAAKSDFVGLFGFTKTTTMVWHKLVEVSRQQLQEMQAVELLQMGDEQQQQQPGCPAAG